MMLNPRAIEKLNSMRSATVPYELRRGDLSLMILKNVYPTSELSEILVDVMDDPLLGVKANETILDYGTGAGYLAIQAARRGAHVVAVDISQDCITCGQDNAKRAGVSDRVEFRCGENLSSLKPGEQFDSVYAGMPMDDEPALDMAARSICDPGFAMRNALFGKLGTVLKSTGRTIISAYEGHEKMYPEIYDRTRFDFKIARARMIKDIMHYALLVTPKPKRTVVLL